VNSTPLPRVVDAAPLISLAKVGRLDVLTADSRIVLVTDTVAREVQAGADADPARLALQSGWGTRHADVPVAADLAAWHLDAGEEAVLALARLRGCAAVLDDGAAVLDDGAAVLDDGAGRKAARALGIIHTGTTGLVIEAKRQGIVMSAADLLRDLRRAGLYLPTDAILQAVLHTIGEDWT